MGRKMGKEFRDEGFCVGCEGVHSKFKRLCRVYYVIDRIGFSELDERGKCNARHSVPVSNSYISSLA